METIQELIEKRDALPMFSPEANAIQARIDALVDALPKTDNNDHATDIFLAKLYA